MNAKIAKALNNQINMEFWSANLYLSMSTYFEKEGRKGFAHWFRVQFREEQEHALAFMAYLHARDEQPVLGALAAVPTEWKSAEEIFVAVLEHEQKITALINDLYALAEQEHDFASRQMLNALVAEQVEEEEGVRQILDDLRLVANDGTGMLQLDRELAARVFNAPQLGYSYGD